MKKGISALLVLAVMLSVLVPSCFASKSFQVGDIVQFGSYEQDNSKENGKEPIEWIVLDNKSGILLLISRYILDQHQYHGNFVSTSWEDCDLRSWLNDEFYNKAFSAQEQKGILTATIRNNGNCWETNDKIFLLSVDEAQKYFANDAARRAEPTEYASGRGVYCANKQPYGWWWLRSQANYDFYASFIETSGKNHSGGEAVSKENIGVRPCFWILDYTYINSVKSTKTGNVGDAGVYKYSAQLVGWGTRSIDPDTCTDDLVCSIEIENNTLICEAAFKKQSCADEPPFFDYDKEPEYVRFGLYSFPLADDVKYAFLNSEGYDYISREEFMRTCHRFNGLGLVLYVKNGSVFQMIMHS